jgi:two-component system cell cycle sensor histidine kinase/response regulator CckA
VRNREPLVINDYEKDHPGKKGVPAGHVSLKRRMVVPVFSDGRIVAVGTVANKETEYLDSDVENIGGFMTSAQHILDRKRADDALHESEKRYGALFNGITDAVLAHHITDDGLPGDLIEVNDVACRMLGYTRDELLNMGIGDIDAAESTVDVRRTVEQLRSGQDVLFEQTHVKKDGTRIPVEVHSQTFTFKDRVAVLSTVRDITYRKRAEEERARLEEQLLQSQKMEAIGRLAGGIAHDFNNLLTAISGYSEILLSRLQEQDPMHMPINEIRKASTQAATLTRQLLTFSRKQSLKLEVIDLNAVLTDTAQMLRYVIGENIDLVTVPDPEAKTVRADSAQVAQVIMNLAVNARDAMPNGGKLTIRTANVSLGEGDTNRLALLRPGPYVMLEMADTGSGMTPEIQAHIFEPFFTTKGVGEGTGLGLSTAYGIVRQSGGAVSVESVPGGGAAFRIYLPQHEGAVKVVQPAETAVQPPRVSGAILLVEDEEAVKKMVRYVLEGQGYDVLEAADPWDAIRICEQHEGEISVVISDVIMPEMSGPDLAKRLTSLRPKMRLILMSGYSGESLRERIEMEPGAAFVEKPFTTDQLLDAVCKVLEETRE